MADEPDGKESPAPPQLQDDPGFWARLKSFIVETVAEIDGSADGSNGKEGAPESKEPPRTDRQREEGMAEQVARAVRELRDKERHDEEHAALKAAPQPPQPETKPWRHKVWGDR